MPPKTRRSANPDLWMPALTLVISVITLLLYILSYLKPAWMPEAAAQLADSTLGVVLAIIGVIIAGYSANQIKKRISSAPAWNGDSTNLALSLLALVAIVSLFIMIMVMALE